MAATAARGLHLLIGRLGTRLIARRTALALRGCALLALLRGLLRGIARVTATTAARRGALRRWLSGLCLLCLGRFSGLGLVCGGTAAKFGSFLLAHTTAARRGDR